MEEIIKDLQTIEVNTFEFNYDFCDLMEDLDTIWYKLENLEENTDSKQMDVVNVQRQVKYSNWDECTQMIKDLIFRMENR